MADTVSRFCGILLLKEKKRRPYALLLPHFDGRRFKIPGGMQETGDVSPYDAMIREAMEELEVRPQNVDLQGEYPDTNNPLNLRTFWMAVEWEGQIRTERKLIENEWVEPPMWIEITSDLINEHHPQVVYSHLMALKKGIVWGKAKLETFHYFAQNNRVAA
ncbi:MAG: NUDIX domain-containing protein [Patescibacteria group bacterium]